MSYLQILKDKGREDLLKTLFEFSPRELRVALAFRYIRTIGMSIDNMRLRLAKEFVEHPELFVTDASHVTDTISLYDCGMVSLHQICSTLGLVNYRKTKKMDLIFRLEGILGTTEIKRNMVE